MWITLNHFTIHRYVFLCKPVVMLPVRASKMIEIFQKVKWEEA